VITNLLDTLTDETQHYCFTECLSNNYSLLGNSIYSWYFQMKLLIKYLLQVPLLFFFVTGVTSIVGDDYLSSFLVAFGALLLYTTGDYFGETDD